MFLLYYRQNVKQPNCTKSSESEVWNGERNAQYLLFLKCRQKVSTLHCGWCWERRRKVPAIHERAIIELFVPCPPKQPNGCIEEVALRWRRHRRMLPRLEPLSTGSPTLSCTTAMLLTPFMSSQSTYSFFLYALRSLQTLALQHIHGHHLYLVKTKKVIHSFSSCSS